jgi:AcrR family transcriptional regulator
MGTKDRILAGALALFNRDGFGPATALDIATSLGISPGHLYYHFKGKTELAAALFAQHEAELAMILTAAEAALENAAEPRLTLQTHLHIVLEEMEDYRFLYREIAAVSRAHPGLGKGLARLALHERESLARQLKAFAPAKEAAAAAEQLQLALWALPGQLEWIEGDADPRTRAAVASIRLMGLLALIAPQKVKPAMKKGRPAPDRPSRKVRKRKI